MKTDTSMRNNQIRIAVIMTCYNRCDQTLQCLKSLIAAQNHFNSNDVHSLYLDLFVTDDCCTDNTFIEIKKKISPVLPVTVIKGTGSLYWAGGMRAAWKVALKGTWDYFLLLNDDTVLKENVFPELFKAVDYAHDKFQKEGLYSGITCAPANENETTYGGYAWKNRAKATIELVKATGNVQECDMTNANILLVHISVIEAIGIFSEEYNHGYADFDFSITAKNSGFPVMLTAHICGECENNHLDKITYLKKLCSMTLPERKRHFSNPLFSNKDFETFIRRTSHSRRWIVKIGRWINLYIPRLYLWLHLIREY